MKLSYLLCIAAVAILAVSCYLGPPNEDYHGYEDVSSYNELQSAVSKGKNVRLSNDISAVDLGYEGALFINSNITIDLNGKKLSFVDTGWDSYRDDLPDADNPDFYPSGSVVISPGAVLSIIGNNGCIESDFFTGLISNYGTLRVDAAAMESTGRHIFSNHGSITINSGTFICDDTVFDMCFDSSSLVINDGIFGNNPKTTVLSTGLNTRNAEITVNGGAFLGLFNLSGFTDMVINGGEFEAENSSFFVNSGNLRVNGGTFRSLRNIDWSSYDYVPVNTAYRLGLGLEGDIIIEAEDYHSGNPNVTVTKDAVLSKGVHYYHKSTLKEPLGTVLADDQTLIEVSGLKYMRYVRYEQNGSTGSVNVYFMTKEKAETFTGIPGSILESPESIGPVNDYSEQ